MNDTKPTWAIAQTVLLAAVLISSVMVVCSNSRLEERVIRLEQKGVTGSGGGGGGSVGGGGGGTSAPAQRTPGRGSGVTVAGWGGKQAEVLFVEGAANDAPLRLQDKPLPQNDWYVNRRTSAPKTLNYYATNEGETNTITGYTLGRLMVLDPDRPPNVEPSLAVSWDVSADKLTYTYHLRKGVQFGDGRPFTSADVKFSFDVMRDPAVKADHMRSGFDDVESLETPDPHTVVVRYKKKYWKGLYQFGVTLRVLNKGWYEEQVPVYAKRLGKERFSTQPGQKGFGEVFNLIRIPCPGTGPYYIEKEEDFTEKSIRMVQNPFCWHIQKNPTYHNMVGLRWVFIADEIVAFEEFRKGNFDVTVVDAERYDDQLAKDPTISAIAQHFVYDHIGLDCSYIAWNCRQAPFDDPRVRRAMTHLVDREWIAKEIERGRAEVAVCKSKKSYPTYSHDLEPHPFDVAAAKALLAEAGWRDSDGDGVLDRDGKRFEFELKVPSGRTFFIRVGGAIKDACAKAGIRMDIRALEWSTFIGDYEERKFDSVMLYSSWPDVWIDLYEDFHSSQDVPAGGNSPGWRDATVDALLEKMREEFDDDVRTTMFHEFNRAFYDAQPMTLLVHGKVDVLCNRRFENVKVRPTGLGHHDWWVKPENVRHK
ncbi:MAG: hypothetical protein HMLKMBBP_00657 [Planctomycetes bacterium]|nr:hypothetical protein [Planctomycetota bacterium]